MSPSPLIVSADHDQQVELIRRFIGCLTLVELEQRVQRFERLDRLRVSRREIFDEIMRIICIDDKPEARHFRDYFTEITGQQLKPRTTLGARFIRKLPLTVGQPFYRVRLEENSKFGVKDPKPTTVLKEQGAWNPLAEHCKTEGRLNTIGKPALYTSPLPTVAIAEVGAPPWGTYLSMMVYELVEEADACHVVQGIVVGAFTEDENAKLRLLNNFLRGEFTRSVPRGHERLYWLTQEIARAICGWPASAGKEYDCIAYPSVVADATNYCWPPDIARRKLKLVGV